jgi:hypothetical protein
VAKQKLEDEKGAKQLVREAEKMLTCTTTIDESGRQMTEQFNPNVVNELSSRTCETISTDGLMKAERSGSIVNN